ncbi:hypothetical protein QQX98_012020 [Neonectria punicea]|uniref:Major facilitator superfamily (MFS) profile domain-containing protein n=1 Tax=Neonectria punicea TaxID=979145 RepID=A0ABR1GKC0_9HYPO
MLGSRFVNGIGTGILNGIVPAWASELSDYTSRGTFIAMEFTLNIFGVVVAYWLAYARHHVWTKYAMASQFLQRSAYIPVFNMFATAIFHIAGFVSEKTQWVAGLNNIFYMFATLVCAFTIDRIGRRWTLYWGSVGQAIAMFLVGGLSRGGLDARADGNIGVANQWGAAAASTVYLYTFIFGATWLTVPWLYPAEIFPIHVRAKGNSWGVVGWSIGNGTLTLLLPYIVSAINEKMMYIFGAVNVLSIPIVYALYPESSQRTLEEMDLLFAADTPWAWDAEKTFAALKEEMNGIGGGAKERGMDIEAKGDSVPSDHVETL